MVLASAIPELPSREEVVGIRPWTGELGLSIKRAPTARKLASCIKKQLPVRLWVEDEPDQSDYRRLKLQVTMMQPLEGRPGRYSFTASRLFPDGQVTLAFGLYDEVRKTGELYIKAVGA